MQRFKFGRKACLGLLCGLCLCGAGRLFAQAAPGPMHPTQPLPPVEQPPAPRKEPQVEPRKTIAGFWKLNVDESDDPKRKLDEGRSSRGGPVGGMGGGRPRTGIGFPYPGGGPNGPYGGPGGPGMGGGEGDDRERMQDLIRPADSLTIDLKDPEVDLATDRGDKLVIYTDGRKIQKSRADTVQTISARWNGSQLVTDERSPQGRKKSRTLELSPDGRQFNETWRIEAGRSDSLTTIRYVYDAADQNRR
ncbi:MAG TPA: hypothetical protein VGT24_04655 [Candidatus Acidoferrales bacterium]|nr:hypothetical protein [Candidatus Acidoferrales bacterium]